MFDTTIMLTFFFCSTDLSTYIPKHSVDFSTWQEQKHNNSVNQEDTTAHQTQLTEEVMVSHLRPPLFTCAEKSNFGLLKCTKKFRGYANEFIHFD